MDLEKRSRISIRIDENRSNALPLYSSISLLADVNPEDDSMFRLLKASNGQASRMSAISEDVSISSARNMKKTVSFGKTTVSSFDLAQLLQVITQEVADQLALIVGKSSSHKIKLYHYKEPNERFNKKKVYTLDTEPPTKTSEEKMLKIQHIIKLKIDEVILLLHNIVKDTSDELRHDKSHNTLAVALETFSKTKSDDFTVLNMKANEMCAQLFRDIKRIEKEADRLMETNRAFGFGIIREKDRLLFLNMKKMDYMEKWEKNRRSINKYISNKQCDDIVKYIRSVEDNILKDQEVTIQITSFLNISIEELEQKRDEFPEKLDKECDSRNRVITQLKEDLEKMEIHRKELDAEIKLRTKKMEDWIIYRTQKEAEEAELARIAEEEELARIAEEERIAAELAAEEELLATFTLRERIQYLDNKKKEEKKAAKAAKKAAKLAAKLAKRMARRTA